MRKKRIGHVQSHPCLTLIRVCRLDFKQYSNVYGFFFFVFFYHKKKSGNFMFFLEKRIRMTYNDFVKGGGLGRASVFFKGM